MTTATFPLPRTLGFSYCPWKNKFNPGPDVVTKFAMSLSTSLFLKLLHIP